MFFFGFTYRSGSFWFGCGNICQILYNFLRVLCFTSSRFTSTQNWLIFAIWLEGKIAIKLKHAHGIVWHYDDFSSWQIYYESFFVSVVSEIDKVVCLFVCCDASTPALCPEKSSQTLTESIERKIMRSFIVYRRHICIYESHKESITSLQQCLLFSSPINRVSEHWIRVSCRKKL